MPSGLVCGIIVLTIAAYLLLHLICRLRRTVSTELRDEPCEFHQVCDAKEGATLADDHLRLRSDEVRPLRGNGANDAGADLQQEAGAVSVIPLTDTEELSPAEWMERMRYPHKACMSDAMVCIPRWVTNDSREGSSVTMLWAVTSAGSIARN